MYYTVR
jgi:hypothetical protein